MKAVCLNKSCDCDPAPGANYCCEGCRAADTSRCCLVGCSCGHLDCGVGYVLPAPASAGAAA